nr:venom protein U-MPTX.7-27 [Megalopyge opercularis]
MRLVVAALFAMVSLTVGYNYLNMYGTLYDVALEALNKLVGFVYYKKFIDCYARQGDCSDPVVKYYQPIIEDGYHLACAKCSSIQKRFAKIFFEHGDKEDIEAMKKKYDPEGIYTAKLIQAISHY